MVDLRSLCVDEEEAREGEESGAFPSLGELIRADLLMPRADLLAFLPHKRFQRLQEERGTSRIR